jgi:AmiR/NasT family two-component response regulator
VNNPFQMAVDASAAKQLTAKEYLMKIKGMSEDEANAELDKLTPQEE